MNKTTKIIVGVIIVLLIGIIVYIKNNQQSKGTVKVGVVLPLTGQLAKAGEWMKNSLEMSKDQINQNSGINGKQVQLVYEDTKCVPSSTISALTKLKNVDGIVGYIGPFCGSEIIVAADFSQKNQIIGITPESNFGKLSDYFFSTEPLLAREPQTIADYAHDKLGLNRVGVYYFKNEWGEKIKDSFIAEFEKKGGTVPAVESMIDFTQSDFRGSLTKIMQSRVDGLFFANANSSIVKQLRELGYKGVILSEHNIENPDFVALKNETIYYTYPNKLDINPLASSFLADYQKAYNEKPGLIAYESYDALQVFARGLKACTSSGAIITSESNSCLKNEIMTKEYKGVSGIISIDPVTFDVKIKPVIVKTLKNGTFQEVQ